MPVRDEAEVLAGLPPVPTVPVEQVRQALARQGRVVVVLDDDPTGTQTVADVPVLTTWSVPDIRWAMRQDATVFYVLTNSRSLDPTDALRRTREVMDNVCAASRLEGVDFVVTSRSDSTLRGHFPLEPDAIAECLERELGTIVDGVVLVPAYVEAGRLTIESQHYARTSEGLTPVGESEFARDATFGFVSSDLRDYVEEKTAGRWRAENVARITLEDLREGGRERVAAILEKLRARCPVVVDAVCDDDLRLLALGLLAAEEAGRHFVYRTGPSFVRARAGLEAKAPLSSEQIRAIRDRTAIPGAAGTTHGLVAVGSHVSMSTRQLRALLDVDGVNALDVDVPSLLRVGGREETIAAVVRAALVGLATSDVVVGTSREVTRGADAEESLAIARAVSSAISEIVRRVVDACPPAWIVAKGGITSSDVATEGLGIRRAWARGTLLPGIISLWEPVFESAPATPYVVFAGNVGDERALVKVVETLRGSV